MTSKNDQLKATLVEDPGNPVFAEYADQLRLSGQKLAGMEVCLQGLSLNPNCHKGRLTLAHIYYDCNFLPFAVRELEALGAALPQNRSIKRLLEKLSPGSKSKTTEGEPEQQAADKGPAETVAETEFSFDDIDMIEEAKKEH